MRILCIGDSNTWGYDPMTGEQQKNRWTQILMKLLSEDTIIEEGLNGRTFAFDDPSNSERNGIKRLPTILKTHQFVDLIIVMLGTNDLKTVFHATAADIAKCARTFIEIINNPDFYNGSVPKTLLVSPVYIDDNVENVWLDPEFSVESAKESHLLAEHLEVVAKDCGTAFMNAADYAEASKVDCVHMDGANHQKFAQAIADKIKTLKAEI
ncbi:MAG: GDSL family lipase [Erysipelotrichaceae bacterium]|nr:GDSL family lipase [Erysipelotrichaceae bacterium]